MHSDTPQRIVIMGVSGAGKTTIGEALAERLGYEFIDADDLHSPDAKAKMASGTPLDDVDRRPWLRRIARRLESESNGAVLACSALARRYRAVLGDDVIFIHLDGRRTVLAARLAARRHEYMSPRLLDSQIAALEPLAADERGFAINIDSTKEHIVDSAVWMLQGVSPRKS